MRRFSGLLIIFLLSSLLTACGYQLRQAFTLPEQYTPVSLQVPRQQRELHASMKSQLNLSFVDIADAGEASGLIIRLENVVETNELLTASSEGTPLERELVLQANVRWLDSEGNDVIEAERFRLRRAFSYDDQSILAKEQEAEFLMAELERDLAQRIVVRLRQLSQ